MGDRARLFVAAWPPPDVVALLADLPREERPGVRWVPSGRWHVTLRFLGDADVDAALDAFGRIDARPAEAVLGPRPGRLGAGVLVVPVGGLDALAAAVVAATAGVGEPPDPRPFLGHLTLARLRGNPACGLTAHTVSAQWPVEEVALVRSGGGTTPGAYTTLATLALS